MKKTIKRLCLVLVTASLAAGMARCPERKPPQVRTDAMKNVAPLTPVYDKRNNITLALPEGWKIVRKVENPVLFAVAPGGDTFGPMANLVIETITQRMDPFDYLQANVISMRVAIKGLEFVEGGSELVGDNPAAWIRYTFPRQGVNMEALAYCHTRDYKAYVITCVSKKESYSDLEPTFRAIGRSLKTEE